MTVEVIGIRRGGARQTGKRRILAQFDAEVPGFTLFGCALVAGTNGKLLTFPPETSAKPGIYRAIKFSDAALRDEITAAAFAALTAIGGAIEGGKDDKQ